MTAMILPLTNEGARTLVLGNLEIELDTYRVWVEGRRINMGLHEYDLLLALAEHRDRVVPAADLTRLLWNSTTHECARRLSVLVFRLRAKLQALQPYGIESVRGRGYGLLTLEHAPAPVE